MTTRQNIFGAGLGGLLFLGALFWSKEEDPFTRQWFTVKTAAGGFIKCVAVLPKPIQRRPVIIYAHGSGGSLMTDGYHLRQMAELGLSVVSLEYNQSNEVAFTDQFEALLQYVGRQPWADTNAIAWVGFSLGAINTFAYARQHPAQPPQLLVQLGGAGFIEEAGSRKPEVNLHCPVLLVHGDQDEIFPVADTRRLFSLLQTNGVPVELKILPGLPHNMEPDQGVVFRAIGEYCRSHLLGKEVNYHSLAQWPAGAPPLWRFWLPAAAWMVGWWIWRRSRQNAPVEKTKLSRGQIALRWLAAVLAIWAMTETALHLVPLHLAVSDRTLAIARRILVPPKERADFETLARQPIWNGQKLKTLLDHVELAGYNRELINWQLDDQIYRDFVLSPVIKPVTSNQQPAIHLDWRRPLWEEFYPRIRHESSPADAAQIVVRHLRERVTISTLSGLPHNVPEIWLRQITDAAGFQIIYVAALRSVGVPARLNGNDTAECWNGTRWQPAPTPAVTH